MNKKEFLDALSKQLRLMPKEDKEDALTFYREYLEDYGFDDNEDVTSKIGKPKEIAKSLIAECTMKHIENNEEKKTPRKTARIVWLAIISIFTLPVTLPLAIALLIVVITLLFTLLIVFLSILASALAVIFAGGTAIAASIVAPGIGQKLVVIGTGFLLIGIGMAIAFVDIWIFSLIVKLIIHIIKKSAMKKQMSK